MSTYEQRFRKVETEVAELAYDQASFEFEAPVPRRYRQLEEAAFNRRVHQLAESYVKRLGFELPHALRDYLGE